MNFVFHPYNGKQLVKELGDLSHEEFQDLTLGMQLFQQLGWDANVTVNKYSEYGVWRLKNNRMGRLLFAFTDEEHDGMRVLKGLVVFRKDTNKTPKRLLELARSRKEL